MSRSKSAALALVGAIVLGHSAFVSAADSDIGKDLGATIALQGMSCDKVVEAKRNGDSDYIARCANGNRYHVFVDANGRVVVQKL
jgi:hypothetical protein